MALMVLLLLAGCRSDPARLSGGARQARAAQSKLSVGMTEPQVAAAIGPPTVFRRGAGRRDDVAIYQFPGSRMTVYFHQGRLTRARSVRPPVNR